MIIDLILDRQETPNRYQTRNFRIMVQHYKDTGTDIINALDTGSETDVQNALIDYLKINHYNMEIATFIKGVLWLNVERAYQGNKNDIIDYLHANKQFITSFQTIKDITTITLYTDELITFINTNYSHDND